jgi:SpoVK/Ycf46/Vps4 family AAA+-type ATPase
VCGACACADIITGKGGGCVFLLHGPPGTGKTLTAEAIADLLQRPLYSVTVGELGISPTELEEKLGQILELASCWNAVLLIDEADIFLERRSENDIHRNAMVGIFLRLLEYHMGVLFLTSNRVKSFDEAFHSRISVALHYQSLSRTARCQVYQNLLTAANITGVNAEDLADASLNGRQIKNAIRLAQTLATSRKEPISLAHFASTIEITQQFNADSRADTTSAGGAERGALSAAALALPDAASAQLQHGAEDSGMNSEPDEPPATAAAKPAAVDVGGAVAGEVDASVC